MAPLTQRQASPTSASRSARTARSRLCRRQLKAMPFRPSTQAIRIMLHPPFALFLYDTQIPLETQGKFFGFRRGKPPYRAEAPPAWEGLPFGRYPYALSGRLYSTWSS